MCPGNTKLLRLRDCEVDKNDFDCDVSALNNFIKRFASQNEKRGFGRTYVLTTEDGQGLVGYYTSAVGSLDVEYLPPSVRKKLPHLPAPIYHLARLAVDNKYKGCGFGEYLLFDFLARASRFDHEEGIHAVEVRAKTEQVKSFYRKYGFRELEDDGLHLYLPIEQVHTLIKDFSAL